LKRNKTGFDEDDQMKQAKLQCLQNSSHTNGHKLNSMEVVELSGTKKGE
jgi:hypothetical protein